MISACRINPRFQIAKFGLKQQNHKNLLQGIAINDLMNKKQQLSNMATTQKQVYQTVNKQPKIDVEVGVDKIKGPGMKDVSVVVVGGGPAGLAAALMLAKQGFNNIKVLEALSEEEYYDTSRSFAYGVNQRGQSCLEKLDVLERLREVGVNFSKTRANVISPDGSIKTMPLPVSSNNNNNNQMKQKTQYLVQRQEISNILFDKIENDYKNYVTFYFNAKCVDFKQNYNQELKLTFQIKDEDPISISPYLVIGADGKNSFIRKSLHEITGKEKFELIQKPVIGTGVIAKIIKVPQNFYLNNNKQQMAENENVYRAVAESGDVKKMVGMTSFPPSQMLTQNQSRTIILTFKNQDHNLLKVTDREEFFKFLENQIPQLPIRDIITPEQVDNFIFKKGVKFPLAGYSQNLSYTIQNEKNNYENPKNNFCKGVILIGDAIHHFPPNIGEGVNAALEDVNVLYDLFQKYDSDLECIMHEYENTRIIDSKALIELTQHTTLQPPTNWFVNKYNYIRQLKTFLHKNFPQVFPPQSQSYLRRNELKYSEILELINSANLLYNFYLFILVNTGLFGIAYLNGYFVR